MKLYKIGFSFKGLAAFLLVMFPNMFWMLNSPPNDLLSTNSSPLPVLDAVMSASQWVMIGALILLVRKERKQGRFGRFYAAGCGVCLGIYYVSWIVYFLGVTPPLMLLGMAVFPCAFFILFSLWQRNYPALAPAFVFASLHIGITCANYLL